MRLFNLIFAAVPIIAQGTQLREFFNCGQDLIGQCCPLNGACTLAGVLTPAQVEQMGYEGSLVCRAPGIPKCCKMEGGTNHCFDPVAFVEGVLDPFPGGP